MQRPAPRSHWRTATPYMKCRAVTVGAILDWMGAKTAVLISGGDQDGNLRVQVPLYTPWMYIRKMATRRIKFGENYSFCHRFERPWERVSFRCENFDRIFGPSSVGPRQSSCWQQHCYRQAIMLAVVGCCVRQRSTAKETRLCFFLFRVKAWCTAMQRTMETVVLLEAGSFPAIFLLIIQGV